MKEPAKILQRIGHALQEMGAAFEEAAKTVSAQGLHEADVNVGMVVAEESFTVEVDEAGKPVEIMIEQLPAHIGREVGLRIVQKRSDVVLEGAFRAAPITDENRIAI